jgi:16S rRNA (cytosine967-C5)-methyltransferase
MSRAIRKVACTLRTVRILESVTQKRSKLELAWASQTDGLPGHEQRLIRDMCSGTLRHLHYYSRLLDWHAPPEVSDDEKVRLLAAAALYQHEHMDSPLKEKLLVECTAALGKPWATALVARALQVVPQLSAQERSIALTEASACSMPDWLYTKLDRGAVPTSAYASLLLERPDFLCLCVPPASPFGTPAEYIKALASQGLTASESGIAPLGVVIHERPSDVAALPGVAERSVHIQDVAQQYGLSRLSPLAPGERVLDATAAPGGKTRCLVAHQPHVEVVAVERSRRKADALRTALRSSSPPPSVKVICGDASDPAGWWDGEPFSAVLLDPPCSSSGLLRTLPEVKVHIEPTDVETLQGIQLKLLRAVWPTLRPGGELLYTTCSLLDAENSKIIGRFLKETPEAIPVELALPPGCMGAGLRARRRQGRATSSSHREGEPKGKASPGRTGQRRKQGRTDGRRRFVSAPLPRLAATRPHGGVTFYPSPFSHSGGFVALLRKAV